MTNKVIQVEFRERPTDLIDTSTLIKPNREITGSMMLPANEEVTTEVAEEHKAEPIKSLDDINMVSKYLTQNGRYRDNMLFIVGINFGLRISDLLKLRFSHLIDDSFTFRTTFPIWEQKTRNTRKVAKNRYITINDAVVEAVTLYLQHTQNVRLSDYMFRSESNRSTSNQPLTKKSADRILKGIKNDLGLRERVATHTLRKTFGYHQMMMSGNDPRKLLLLQKIFGHSSSMQTLDYIGITQEEIEDAYLGLNLGSPYNYLVNSKITESTMVS